MALTERNLNIPRKIAPTEKTPTAQSKLPRRIPTPNSTSSTNRWISGGANRVSSAENTPRQNLSHQTSGSAAGTARKMRQTNAVVVDKPLPGEKPLPSRPIARFSNSLSPGKDSRSLIDACEEPLHITSTAGEKQDWPSLTPQSAESMSLVATADFAEVNQPESSQPSSPSRATRASLMAAATTLTNVITGKSSNQETRDLVDSQSSSSSYASAMDGSSLPQTNDDSSLVLKKTRNGDSATCQEHSEAETQILDFPTRQASLRNRISDGSLVKPRGGSFRKVIGFTDFAKTRTASPTPSESRQHSPSPASFSRPRPGSLSHTDSRSIKTASRIPVPETRKSDVVDVDKFRLSDSSMSNPALVPSFGSRRLASPDALKILENGKMRRQLKRMPRDARMSEARTERTWTPDSSATAFTTETPSLSHSVDSSPTATLAPNSPNVGPVVSSPHEDHRGKVAQDSPTQQQQCHGMTRETRYDSNPAEDINFEDSAFDVAIRSRRPPTTSPFTMPLQTIPSQAVLPTENAHKHEEEHTELIRTLSRLEGQGSPPKTDVDQQTLLHMFGHLKRSLDKTAPNSATLSENAAAAEKYLAQHDSTIPEANLDRGKEEGVAENQHLVIDDSRNTLESLRTGKKNQTMISKWSDSTPSTKGFSPVADSPFAGQTNPSIESRRSTAASKNASNDEVSVCYPSRIQAMMNPTSAQISEVQIPEETANVAPSTARRCSSPTLGKHHKPHNKPGSVRAARQGIKVANASFTRTTLSAESKKAARFPTPNTKLLKIPETESRGRSSPIQRHRSRRTEETAPKISLPNVHPQTRHSNKTQTPRSRSRSRYVLDKINGIFSGKRDRNYDAVPPLPKIENGAMDTKDSVKSDVETSGNGSPTKTPKLPKMPSLSPSIQTALGSISPTTANKDETATADSHSDSQSVQNLSEHVVSKAQRETNPQRKERLLNFAKECNSLVVEILGDC